MFFLSMVGRSGLGVLGGIVGISVHKLNAHLLGEGELDSLAGGGAKSSDAFGDRDAGILDLRDGDALVLNKVSAGDPGEGDGLVHTGLDGLGIGDGHLWLNNSDNGDIVAGLLGDLLAVVVTISVTSISSMAISVLGRLADCHHLGLTLLLEGDLNSLGGGDLILGLVGVGADLVVNLLDGLSADGTGDIIALLHLYDDLDGQVNIIALSDNGGGAHLGSLNNVDHGAVVLGVLIAVVVATIGWGVVGWGMVGVGRDGTDQGDEGKKSEDLHV